MVMSALECVTTPPMDYTVEHPIRYQSLRDALGST